MKNQRAGWWWRTPLSQHSGRQRKADFWVRGQPSLQCEFQDSQGYIEKPCLKKTKSKKQNKKQKTKNKTTKKKNSSRKLKTGLLALPYSITFNQGTHSQPGATGDAAWQLTPEIMVRFSPGMVPHGDMGPPSTMKKTSHRHVYGPIWCGLSLKWDSLLRWL